ncbi:MAG: hypothetical protein GY710_17320 [Desulfobacteraceae bacterium]|nr:hypothetical protein [Desulfobacteraceae bacterium]
MPEYLRNFFSELSLLIPVALLSILGGVVNYINKPKEQFSLWIMLAELITALFVGLVVHFLLQSTSLPPGIKSAVIALSGYVSRDVLFLLKRFFLSKIKKELM